MPTDPASELIIAAAYLGNFRERLKRWMIYYQSLPETAIMPNHPREIVQQLHSIDRAYTILLKQSHRLN